MTSYISAEVRRHVIERAERLCEYCLIHAEDTFFGCEVDHILSEKHGGPTEAADLALACMPCNRAKGTDIGSVARSSGVFSRFFNPRSDSWAAHFQLNGAMVRPLTEIGEATAAMLGFNSVERLLERELLIRLRRYPSAAALRRMHE